MPALTEAGILRIRERIHLRVAARVCRMRYSVRVAASALREEFAMNMRPGIRTTDALGRYVLRHLGQSGREIIAPRPLALSIGQRLFRLSDKMRGIVWLIPGAIRGVKKGCRHAHTRAQCRI
ncbi:hypothetical protein GCM10010915_11520 [Microbacterium faecale]|uniref:Uncharacterized protein n=1 Tax=Microbacterium faecale TaxID=1804630 RepID=A0A916Y613_9MICO|nr:hypothetical protein GCM10010915_11520 [Microbacterium faecale]